MPVQYRPEGKQSTAESELPPEPDDTPDTCDG